MLPRLRLHSPHDSTKFAVRSSNRTFLDEQRRCSTGSEAAAQRQAVIDELLEPGDDVEQLFPEAMTVQPVTLPRSTE
jgi:hypothetical protein